MGDSKLVVYEGQLCVQEQDRIQPVQHPLADQLLAVVARNCQLTAESHQQMLDIHAQILADLQASRRQNGSLTQMAQVPMTPVMPVSQPTQASVLLIEDRGLFSAVGGFVVILGLCSFFVLSIGGLMAIISSANRPIPVYIQR
jgi:hypothetical protein